MQLRCEIRVMGQGHSGHTPCQHTSALPSVSDPSRFMKFSKHLQNQFPHKSFSPTSQANPQHHTGQAGLFVVFVHEVVRVIQYGPEQFKTPHGQENKKEAFFVGIQQAASCCLQGTSFQTADVKK